MLAGVECFKGSLGNATMQGKLHMQEERNSDDHLICLSKTPPHRLFIYGRKDSISHRPKDMQQSFLTLFSLPLRCSCCFCDNLILVESPFFDSIIPSIFEDAKRSPNWSGWKGRVPCYPCIRR